MQIQIYMYNEFGELILDEIKLLKAIKVASRVANEKHIDHRATTN